MAKKVGRQGEFGKEKRKTRRRSLAKKRRNKEKKFGKERRKTRRVNLA